MGEGEGGGDEGIFEVILHDGASPSKDENTPHPAPPPPRGEGKGGGDKVIF